jgi:putative ABC transport system ATP-binding protein
VTSAVGGLLLTDNRTTISTTSLTQPVSFSVEGVDIGHTKLGPLANAAVSAGRAFTGSDGSAHLPSELSGGQQQRVAIARALVKEPKVLLADEPTGNLDEEARDEIIALMEKPWRERGLTLVLVSHDAAIARRAQRTVVMSRGRLAMRS